MVLKACRGERKAVIFYLRTQGTSRGYPPLRRPRSVPAPARPRDIGPVYAATPQAFPSPHRAEHSTQIADGPGGTAAREYEAGAAGHTGAAAEIPIVTAVDSEPLEQTPEMSEPAPPPPVATTQTHPSKPVEPPADAAAPHSPAAQQRSAQASAPRLPSGPPGMPPVRQIGWPRISRRLNVADRLGLNRDIRPP